MASSKRKILVLPGDHAGPEVVAEALKVLDVLTECLELNFEISHDIAGGCSIDRHGVPITATVLDKAEQSHAVLFGSVGGPEWGTAQPSPEHGLLLLRQRLGAFVNIRPANFIAQSLIDRSPLKPEHVKDTNFVVVRENCGGAYFGPKVEEEHYASDVWGYERYEIERCARVSGTLARLLGRDGCGGGGPAVVWSADKANVLASGRIWRRVTTQVFEEEFPDVELKHQLADSLAMLMVKSPSQFNGIIHTDNTFGDMLSDLAGGVIGTLGLLPSASLCGIPKKGDICNGIYEPVHGSAPDIAGQGRVNPVAQILSVAMMLRYSFALADEALLVERAVQEVLSAESEGGQNVRTGDLGGTATTSQVGDAICATLRRQLQKEHGQQRGNFYGADQAWY